MTTEPELSADAVESVRLAVYHRLAGTGQAPSTSELATACGLSDVVTQAALQRLHGSRDLVLDADGQIVLAHPFATIPLGFSVMGSRTLWWGGCCWDSFAIPHLVPDEPSVLVASTCPGCGSPHALVVDRDQPPAGSLIAHFLTPVSRIWNDVVHACAHQRLFCSEVCVDAWVGAHDEQRGYLMDLGTLWRMAQGWYAGRLDRGYQRREPQQAAEYFASVGLRGAFWRLP